MPGLKPLIIYSSLDAGLKASSTQAASMLAAQTDSGRLIADSFL